MEAYVLDICNRERGSLLQNKTFLNLDGPVFSVSNSLRGQPVRFVRAAWDSGGRRIAAGDCHGNVYLLCLEKNRFERVARLKVCSSCIVFPRSSSLLVALSDGAISLLCLDSKRVENEFPHHPSAVSHISLSREGATVLSCCQSRAILWSLDTFDVVRVLTLKQDVHIVKVFFLPDKDAIVSAFSDDSVFLWDFKEFNCIGNFLCSTEGSYLNVKTVAASRDGQLIGCGGRANWFVVWSVVAARRICTLPLPPHQTSVRQIAFLPNLGEDHLVCVLTGEGDVCVYNVSSGEVVHRLTGRSGKIVSMATPRDLRRMLVVSFPGSVELFNVEEALTPKEQPMDDSQKLKLVDVSSRSLKANPKTTKKLTKARETNKKEKSTFAIDRKKLLSIVKSFEKYPEQQRLFIWSRLLSLPHNVEAFRTLHQGSLSAASTRECPSTNPGTRAAFSRLMSLLECWLPVLKEVKYIQSVVLPFVKVLHKNMILCFEILISLISNWCRSWLVFCPFPPFQVLCAVEGVLAHHDPQLAAHFLAHALSPEVYAWCLLKTSFSEVLERGEWLHLWDHIFANPLAFQLYAVAAFSIASRNVLLTCQTRTQLKACYKKRGVSTSSLLRVAYRLQQTSPANVDPGPLMGTFHPLPEGCAYPALFEHPPMKIQLQTGSRKQILEEEIDYLQQREERVEVRGGYLRELQDLQLRRRKLLLQLDQLTDASAIEALEKKLQSTQSLIQGNLLDQASSLKGPLGVDTFSNNKEVCEKQYFKFQNYANKLSKKIY